MEIKINNFGTWNDDITYWYHLMREVPENITRHSHIQVSLVMILLCFTNVRIYYCFRRDDGDPTVERRI